MARMATAGVAVLASGVGAVNRVFEKGAKSARYQLIRGERGQMVARWFKPNRHAGVKFCSGAKETARRARQIVAGQLSPVFTQDMTHATIRMGRMRDGTDRSFKAPVEVLKTNPHFNRYLVPVF